MFLLGNKENILVISNMNKCSPVQTDYCIKQKTTMNVDPTIVTIREMLIGWLKFGQGEEFRQQSTCFVLE